MKDLLIKLAEACGPTGVEDNVRDLLQALVTPHADDVRVDVLGNLLVTKKGKGAARKHLLLVAHMDEPGLMVNHIETNGFLRLAPVGTYETLSPAYLVGQRIEFPNGTKGVIGTSAKDPGDVTVVSLFADIGVTSREEVLARVQEGDFCALHLGAFAVNEHRVVGKAIERSAICAAALEALKQLGEQEHDVTVAFTVQQAVGGRGAKPAAFGVEADFALVLDAVTAGDTLAASRSEIRIGAGPAIKLLDKVTAVRPQVKHFLIDEAEAAGVAYQLDVGLERSSEAGLLFAHASGLLAGALSVPVRYSASASELVDVRDIEATVALTVRAIHSFAL